MERSRLQRLADFFHEAGMLRFTPRSGYQFLGSGRENVAEHSFRTAVIGYALARLAGADAAKTALICLFHDLGEARTGDLNYVNQRYGRPEERRAVEDAAAGTGLEEDILTFWDAHEAGRQADAPLESRLARDADQLDLILNLKREWDLGNAYAERWMNMAVARLKTQEARELAEVIAATDHTDWWFLGADRDWWVSRKR
ncbi:MAG: HD domain-containing protein [Desulfovibrionaceae bacterium]|nr:HD domain-containing protein [Desulfovibrionaceae bacterium]